MGERDKIFDLLMELSDFAMENGLPLTSYRLETVLDVFLHETGRLPKRLRAPDPVFRSGRKRGRPAVGDRPPEEPQLMFRRRA